MSLYFSLRHDSCLDHVYSLFQADSIFDPAKGWEIFEYDSGFFPFDSRYSLCFINRKVAVLFIDVNQAGLAGKLKSLEASFNTGKYKDFTVFEVFLVGPGGSEKVPAVQKFIGRFNISLLIIDLGNIRLAAGVPGYMQMRAEFESPVRLPGNLTISRSEHLATEDDRILNPELLTSEIVGIILKAIIQKSNKLQLEEIFEKVKEDFHIQNKGMRKKIRFATVKILETISANPDGKIYFEVVKSKENSWVNLEEICRKPILAESFKKYVKSSFNDFYPPPELNTAV